MTLNVVVHYSMLEEDEREPSYIPGEKLEAIRALERIRDVRKRYSRTTIFFEGFDFGNLPNICKSSRDVTLYGCARGYCLELSAKTLMKKGYVVSFDIDGTTF